MRDYLVEAAEIAQSSQHLIGFRLTPCCLVVEGQVGGNFPCGRIIQKVPWEQLEQAIINPAAIAIQMVENEIEAVEALQEQIGMAYQ